MFVGRYSVAEADNPSVVLAGDVSYAVRRVLAVLEKEDL